jgi:hypothetical protein
MLGKTQKGGVLAKCSTSDQFYGAFTLDVELMLNTNLGGILGGTQC